MLFNADKQLGAVDFKMAQKSYMKKVLQKLILTSLSLLAISGCVGTVNQASAPSSLFSDESGNTFSFSGLIQARPIAHDKIEIEFNTVAPSGVTYSLFINDSINGLTIDPGALTPTFGGRFLYTVTNLLPNTTYKLKLAARKSDGSRSANEPVRFATTFDNRVADFLGIKKVSLEAGNTSSGIQVEWIPSIMQGLLVAGPFDVSNYEVTIISQVGGVANLNNPTYSGTDKKIKLVPEPPAVASPFTNPSLKIVDNLMPGTNYYVQVRAIHSLYKTYVDANTNPIPINKDSNTKYLSIRTANNGGFFDFDRENVVLSNPIGIDGFDKIDIFWRPGNGPFSGYRIFAKEYTAGSDPMTDDQLTEAELINMTGSLNFTSMSPSLNYKRLSGLNQNSFYQVKVVLCKTVTCPVAAADPNAGIVSELKAIKVSPTLTPFSGIYEIANPGEYSARDEVNLKFDAPVLSEGFANKLEFYCVNPADYTQMVKFDDTNPIVSAIPQCNGLYLPSIESDLSVYRSQKVKGLAVTGTTQFCFAATPAILGYGPDVRLPLASRIVKCAYPEIIPPTNNQFPGLIPGCSVSGVTATVNWNEPTGGVYSGFKVFWKEKNGPAPYSFTDAIASAPGYTATAELPLGTNSHAITGLMPGRTYQIGTLATADMDAPVPDLYSEFNLNVVECTIPLPIATFKGFNRILALGPKIDGRVPNDSSYAPPASAQIYESVNDDGIPYEVEINSGGVPNDTANFAIPPGRDYGASFIDKFDGKGNSLGRSLSNTGVISLAWEEMDMSFPEAQTLFESYQAPTSRVGRQWGYKVYRSSDNKLTWTLVSDDSNNIYSTTYSYYERPNAALPITKRVSFFTDYSVNSLKDSHDATNGRDIERARIYYYRIVPHFDNKTLTVSNQARAIVKVTLPPANMALVHRWMANRARCMELGKTILIDKNYGCDYYGAGTRPTGVPYQVGNTMLDQGADLLIDRYELGCRYTRGDYTTVPRDGASEFSLPGGSRRDPDDRNYYPLFRGYSTLANVETPSKFRGCTGDRSQSRLWGASDYHGAFELGYQKYLHGDCIGSHAEFNYSSACTPLQFAQGTVSRYYYNIPGADNLLVADDCSAGTAAFPTTTDTKFSFWYMANNALQSEFLAVFANTTTYAGYGSPVYGPVSGDVTAAANRNNPLSYLASSCAVNLAAIDGSGYQRPRWVNMGSAITFKGSTQYLASKTVNELTEITSDGSTLYNGNSSDVGPANFKLPDTGLRNSYRYRNTTRLAKIALSNSAKLPPLTQMSYGLGNHICQQSFVQVGYGSDTSFLATSGVKAKRTLARPEFVAATSWPETFNTTDINNIENTPGSANGSCNNTTKNVVGTGLGIGWNIPNRAARNEFVAQALMSGSSEFNRHESDNDHSSKCISRYGIQDLVGNMAEVAPETLYCDYAQDQAYIGEVAGWDPANIINKGATDGMKYGISNSYGQQRNTAILKSGTIAGAPASMKFTFRDASPAVTANIAPWARISTESGYCSIVDNDSTRRTSATNPFRDLSGLWTTHLYSDGTRNPAVAPLGQFDNKVAGVMEKW
jgi:hypothetical protein